MSIRHPALLGLLTLLALPAMAAAPAATPATPSPAAASAASAQTVTGNWLASVDAGGTPVELAFTLKADGEKLTGSLSVMGNATPISDGRIKGEDVSFKLAFDMGQGGPALDISYVGKLKGDTLTLRSSFSMGEGAPPMVTDFVAKRVP